MDENNLDNNYRRFSLNGIDSQLCPAYDALDRKHKFIVFSRETFSIPEME